MEYVPVKVGNGKEVHAGYNYGSIQKPWGVKLLYTHKCGVGNTWNVNKHPEVKRLFGDDIEITCEKCKRLIGQ